jgi:glycosyltransferase involved in cell wall biosynthesis
MKTAIFINHLGHYHDARFRAYAARADAVTVISTIAQAPFKEFSASTIADRPYVKRVLFANDNCYLRAMRGTLLWSRVIELLGELDPEVVVIPGWASAEGLIALLWARAQGRGAVIVSESQEMDTARSFPREFIKKRIVKACDTALVGGRTHLDYMVNLGMPAERVFVGYDVVDNNHFQCGADVGRAGEVELRERLALPGKYILASGRFVRKKNFNTLIRAYAKFAPRAEHDLVILGDGPERLSLNGLIGDLGLHDRVQMPGFQSYDLLPYYYGLASFFVHVSTVEQWGLVVNEAMAAGLPVIVSRACGSAQELVTDGVNGYLVDPLDQKTLAQQIEGLAADEMIRREMSGAAQRAVLDYGPERFAAGLVQAAKVAVNNKKKGNLSVIDASLIKFLTRFRAQSVA